MSKQSGAAWLRECRITNLSPLGERVADLLGDLFTGLYHLEDAEKVDWSNGHHIEVRVRFKEWSTFDPNLLTKLVFLCHDRCIRCSLGPRSAHAQTLLFHERQREGGVWTRHPTIEQALAEHRKWYPLDDRETPGNADLERYRQIVTDVLQGMYLELREGAIFENPTLAIASRIELRWIDHKKGEATE